MDVVSKVLKVRDDGTDEFLKLIQNPFESSVCSIDLVAAR
jgi:hypothetical protein